MKKLLLWSTLILTIALFLEYWIFDNPVFHIPERISIAGTSINIAGALLSITALVHIDHPRVGNHSGARIGCGPGALSRGL
jgi:hypothetical protein